MGELRTRKRGRTWEWSFEGAKIGGKRNAISKGGYRTKAEALAAGTQAKAEYDNAGRVFVPSEISLADYLDYWLEEHVKRNLTHNSYLDYESKVRIHIKPALGSYRLSSIEPDIIQRWIDDKKTQGLSRSMVKNLLSCLSGAMNYAILPCKYIKFNPCAPVRIGKIPDTQLQREHREYVCSRQDIEKIFGRFGEGSIFYLPLMAGYHLGTRLGESYGIDLLTDIDLDKGEITIRHQMQKEDRIWYYRPPKYDSVRTIKMDTAVAQAFRQEITRRKRERIRYGEYFLRTYLKPDQSIVQVPADISVPYQEIMPLSARENGTLLTPDSFKYCARVIHNELGLPLFHNHSLRHTHGTVLAEAGVNPRTVMERLGHKDISVTLQTYTFNTDRMQSDAIAAFEKEVM